MKKSTKKNVREIKLSTFQTNIHAYIYRAKTLYREEKLDQVDAKINEIQREITELSDEIEEIAPTLSNYKIRAQITKIANLLIQRVILMKPTTEVDELLTIRKKTIESLREAHYN